MTMSNSEESHNWEAVLCTVKVLHYNIYICKLYSVNWEAVSFTVYNMILVISNHKEG